MNESILATKLRGPRPVTPNIMRPRLTQLLDQGLQARLCLISAPAGFGKTALLSGWASQLRPPAAWLTLDEQDNDTSRFTAHFLAALQVVEPELVHSVPAQRPSDQPVSALMAAVINRAAALDHPLVMVLDDYHLVNAEPIHQAIAYLLEHLPLLMHLFIATRADPPLPIARLRGRGQLVELHQSELRFDFPETAAFLNGMMGLDLTSQECQLLGQKTEGWIAGLQLAALSLRGRQDTGSFIQSFSGSNRFILDYLMDEVLQRQDREIKSFLCQTAILGRFCAPLCEAVTGRKGAQRILEQLERANLFIEALDDERQWYRYHRLFADLLRRRLRTNQPELIAELHLRASQWYEHQGELPLAIEHALDAEDPERAAELIEQEAERTLMNSQIVTFNSWMERVPGAILRQHPSLQRYHAWSQLISSHYRQSEMAQWLSQIAPADGDELQGGDMLALRAFLALFGGDLDQSLALFQRSLSLIPKESRLFRSAALLGSSASHLREDHVQSSIKILEKTLDTTLPSGSIMTTVILILNLARLRIKAGQLNQAKADYERALRLAVDGQGRYLPVAGAALVGIAELWREWNQLERATQCLEEGIDLLSQWGEIRVVGGLVCLARVRLALEDFVGSEQALQQAREAAARSRLTRLDDIEVELYQTRLWIKQGQLEAAEQWLAERGVSEKPDANGHSEPEPWFSQRLRKYEHLLLARLLLAKAEPGRALRLLTPHLSRLQEQGRVDFMIEIQILRALAFQLQAETAAATKALKQALQLAETEGYVRLFLDEGTPMATLLYEAAARDICPAYCGRLLADFPYPAPPEQDTAGGLLIEPLSQRQLEVLRLIADGLSNREIAQRLSLSLSTVKVHARDIYGKLEVASRTQAVARARALEIL